MTCPRCGRPEPWDWHRDARGQRCGNVSLDATGVRQQAQDGSTVEGRISWVAEVFNPTAAHQKKRGRIWDARYLSGLMSLPEIGRQLLQEARAVGLGQADVLIGLDGVTLSLAAEGALETLPRTVAGELAVKPEIRSDNGSGYISKEFHGLLEHHGLTHHKITPHCPEENGIMERANRTFREGLAEVELDNRIEAEDALRRITG